MLLILAQLPMVVRSSSHVILRLVALGVVSLAYLSSFSLQALAQNELSTRMEQLEEARQTLKSEFVGLDDVIDQVLNSMRPWYLMPESLERPIVINLVGMTGTGKSSLVRRIVEVLGVEKSFATIDLGEHAMQSGESGRDDDGIISQHWRQNERPTVFLVDDFHKGRTKTEDGYEMDRPFMRPLWALLSDGIVQASIDKTRIEGEVAEMRRSLSRHSQGQGEDEGAQEIMEQLYFIGDLKRALYLATDIEELIEEYLRDPITFFRRIQGITEETGLQIPLDFRQSVVFVSSNLDEAYRDSQESDPDSVTADELHAKAKMVTISDVRAALLRRFVPEEVGRLGNNFVLYPTLSEEGFRSLIRKKLEAISKRTRERFGMTVSFNEDVLDCLYGEGVVATQGARPTLSAISQLIESNVPSWLVAAQLAEGVTRIQVSFDSANNTLTAKGFDGGVEERFSEATQLDLPMTRLRSELDPEPMRTINAYHEAGHAVVGMILFGELPLTVRSKSSMSGGGGYTHFFGPATASRERLTTRLSMILGGRAAEEIVFGADGVSGGAQSDLEFATDAAAEMVTTLGMGDHLAVSAADDNHPLWLRTLKNEDDRAVEVMLQRAYQTALGILARYRSLLDAFAAYLREHPSLPQDAMERLVSEHVRGVTGFAQHPHYECVRVLEGSGWGPPAPPTN